MAAKRWTKIGRAGRLRAWGGVSSLKQRGRWQVIPHSTPGASWPSPASYSIMEGSLVSRIWSVRIQGIDISIGNWMRRPMVNSRKNSRNQSWERSQHCCRASGRTRREPWFNRQCSHVTAFAGHWLPLLRTSACQVRSRHVLYNPSLILLSCA